jgi:GxxExxY protein
VELIHKEITSQIISASFEVSNCLGTGFLEKVYENALKIELELRGLKVITQQPVMVLYKSNQVGLYQTDIIVEDKVIVEVKSTERIAIIHTAQVINYLKATGLEVGLIINFGNPKVEFERVVLQNR